MADVELLDDGTVLVDGDAIIGRWRRAQLGAGYFEDEGVLSTETMSLDSLRAKIGEMYGHDKMEPKS